MSDERKDLNSPVDTPSAAAEDPQKVNLASRARNRTVMLTPDVAGHVRSLIGSENTEQQVPAIGSDYERPRGVPNTLANEGFSVQRPQRSSQEFLAPVGLPRSGFPSSGPLHAVQSGAPMERRGPRPGSGPMEVPRAMHSVPVPAPVQAPRSRIIGFLISFDKNKNGEIFELRVGRWIVSSRPIEHGEHLLIDDETISPLHGILRVTDDGKIQVLDQLSEFGTGVIAAGTFEEKEIAGAMTSITHGDIVRFGKRRFITCIIPTIEA